VPRGCAARHSAGSFCPYRLFPPGLRHGANVCRPLRGLSTSSPAKLMMSLGGGEVFPPGWESRLPGNNHARQKCEKPAARPEAGFRPGRQPLSLPTSLGSGVAALIGGVACIAHHLIRTYAGRGCQRAAVGPPRRVWLPPDPQGRGHVARVRQWENGHAKSAPGCSRQKPLTESGSLAGPQPAAQAAGPGVRRLAAALLLRGLPRRRKVFLLASRRTCLASVASGGPREQGVFSSESPLSGALSFFVAPVSSKLAPRATSETPLSGLKATHAVPSARKAGISDVARGELREPRGRMPTPRMGAPEGRFSLRPRRTKADTTCRDRGPAL
jgi:hypothetical protein